MSVWSTLRETTLLWLANHLPRSRKFDRNRWRILRVAGMDTHRSNIRAPLNITQYGLLRSIHIGEGTFINVGFRVGVGAPAQVRIGDNCQFGPYVQLETMHHDLVWTPERRWGRDARDIIIGDRCWLASRVIVLGGVTIGEGAVVAAGAVVTRDVSPYTLVGGVPARVIRSLR